MTTTPSSSTTGATPNVDENAPLLHNNNNNTNNFDLSGLPKFHPLAAGARSASEIAAALESAMDQNNPNNNNNGNNGDNDPDNSDGDNDHDHVSNHQTTVQQTFIHLLKGYIGPGMLSLPWAVSQLGIPVGIVGIFVMALWSSYNCWTVVRLKRFIERQQQGREIPTTQNSAIMGGGGAASTDGGDLVSETASSVATTNITYPDVGEWAYGKTFQSYVSGCICTQQLAICTVFISFVGENVLAVLNQMAQQYQWHLIPFVSSHGGVMTLALPLFMSLSFIPSLKGLSSVMMLATVLLIVSLALLGLVVEEEWWERPTEPEQGIASFQAPKAPLALCAILYSFEGICLVLPIESAMKESKHFQPVFMTSMAIVSLILAIFSSLCVAAFGIVTNGSITAFLIVKFQENQSLQWLLLLTNLAVSLSVLFTYPLQLYPAVELLAPSWSKFVRNVWKTCCCCCYRWCYGLKDGDEEEVGEEEEGEKDLTGFDPLPPLPEHGGVEVSQWDWDELEEHRYEDEYYNNKDNNYNENSGGGPGDGGGTGGNGLNDAAAAGPVGTVTLDIIGRRDDDDDNNKNNDDAVSLRSFLSSAISFPNQMMPKMVLQGDSPQLRATLVMLTFGVAVIVPNVQALISLAGALAGSSSALLIPPIMKLAYVRHLEEGLSSGTNNNNSNNTPTLGTLGGPGHSIIPSSPIIRNHPFANKQQQQQNDKNTTATNTTNKFFSKWWKEKLECYILFVLGVIFLVIGTNASIMDIVAIYMHKNRRM